jgi:hypothetical protein
MTGFEERAARDGRVDGFWRHTRRESCVPAAVSRRFARIPAKADRPARSCGRIGGIRICPFKPGVTMRSMSVAGMMLFLAGTAGAPVEMHLFAKRKHVT